MPEPRPHLTPLEDGPYLVDALEQIDTAQGPRPCDGKVALCRCGRSANKPLCDGTHAKVGFSSEKIGGSSPDRRSSYVGQQVTVHDNRAICAHAAFCTNELPEVFRMKQKPWIDPDAAPVDRVIAQVRKCPSGALSHSVGQTEHRDDPAAKPSIFVAPKGPYVVRGGCTLAGAQWGEGASQEHYTLCRCGGSRNKPFCDGSHWRVWKDGEDAPTGE